jgi:hypothetical protein
LDDDVQPAIVAGPMSRINAAIARPPGRSRRTCIAETHLKKIPWSIQTPAWLARSYEVS